MKYLLITLFASLTTIIFAQGPAFEWAKGFGGTSADNGNSIAFDPLGNVYSAGFFQGTVDFDPGAGTFNLTSSGNFDVYVQKLDATGNFVWAVAIGGANNDRGNSLTIDNSGNVYITGTFEGSVDFDPSAGVSNHTSAGLVDVFVLKLDATGNFIWSKSFGGTDNEQVKCIDSDATNNIYLTGVFQQTVDFDPGPGTSNAISAGLGDVFIQKLDDSGNFLWAKTFGGTLNDFSSGLDVDISGNVYTNGSFRGTVDFDPNAGTSNFTSAGTDDFFLQKLDASGNFIWAKTFGGASTENPISLITDASGNVYSCGFFLGTADFDPGAGSTILSPNGSYDVFVHKMDPSGNFLWARSIGGPDGDFGRAISVDAFGNVYTTGSYTGTVDFDPGTGTLNHTSVAFSDIFIQKMDESGNFLWARSFGGGTGISTAYSIGVDATNSIFTTGKFGGTGDFDPNTGTSNLSSNGGDDIFVHKMSQCLPNTGTDTQVACDSYSWIDGNTYTTSNNTATSTLTNLAGCDSVVTLDLTINNSNTGTDFQTACDSYTWIDGNTYTASNNTATWTLTNLAGCDSVVTLDLTINNSNTGTDVRTACNSYTWIDGNTYTASNNTATWTLTNVAGCDSAVTLDLTINSVSDITTAVNGITISANNSNATYAWLDCDNNYAVINGETNASFTPTANGNYAVELSENGCVDTSACVAISTVGAIENTFNEDFTLYPNPTDGMFSIEFSSSEEQIVLKIMDASGKLIDRKNYKQVDLIEYELIQPNGIYLIEVSDVRDQRSLIRLIKQ